MSFDAEDVLGEFAEASGMGRELFRAELGYVHGGFPSRRAVKTAWMNDWYRRNIDAARARNRTRYAATRADPARWAAFKERHYAAVKRYRAKHKAKTPITRRKHEQGHTSQLDVQGREQGHRRHHQPRRR